MSLDFETPIEIIKSRKVEDISIEYFNLMEISQGGPEVGRLLVNGELVSKTLLFGGPLIFNKGIIYLPVFIRRLCVSGFKICKINSRTLEIEFLGKLKNLIFLDRVEDNKVYYFEDLNKAKLYSLYVS